jgi:DNA-binding response OmpR family regulator
MNQTRHRPPRRENWREPVIRIVLVEDDDLMREWLGRSLASRGYSVARFARAEHAIPAVAADPPDVVVSDVRMPGMSGFDMGRTLREQGVDVPFVFMTADPTESLDDEATTLGARPVLRKPFGDVAELWEAVDTAITDAAERTRAESVADLTETSHALRTPLTAVRMAFEGLLAERTLDDRERHLAEIAVRNLDRLATAVEDHLEQLAVAGDLDPPLH